MSLAVLDGAASLTALKSLLVGGEHIVYHKIWKDSLEADHDAFGRGRVSNPVTVFDSKTITNVQYDLFWANDTTGGGASHAFRANEAARRLTVAASGEKTTEQSRRWLNYQPGKSQLVFGTFNAHGAVANVAKRVGQFNDDNGLFFELTGTNKGRFGVRTYFTGSAVDTYYNQADWNIDSFGEGALNPSALTIDWTKAQILVIDYEWLGVGSVRFGFVINGSILWAHYVWNANNVVGVYMSSPNNPIRYEIEATGVPGSGDLFMDSICCTVISEGGIQNAGVSRSASNGTTARSISTEEALLSIALGASYLHHTVQPIGFDVNVASGTDFYWRLVLNTTLGGSPSYTAVTNSGVEVDVAGTTLTGGSTLAEGYGSSQLRAASAELSDVYLGSAHVAGGADTPDTLTLAVAKVGGGGAVSFYGALRHREAA